MRAVRWIVLLSVVSGVVYAAPAMEGAALKLQHAAKKSSAVSETAWQYDQYLQMHRASGATGLAMPLGDIAPDAIAPSCAQTHEQTRKN